MSPIVQAVPSEYIEIARSIHVTGIDFPSKCVDEIVLHKHLVPCADEIDRNVVGDLQVTVHSEETLERTVDGVMERNRIETIIRWVS